MIKLLSLFSGIGAFEKALSNLQIPVETVNYCEIDKYAAKAYSLIHGIAESKNLNDVTTIKTELLPNDIDFLTYGFPCQDISNAGLQKGFTDTNGNLTRSGLFFEALRIIEACKPKIAIAENVKALTTERFTAEFATVLNCLQAAGYYNYWAVLNAKDYGTPQNRERVFIVSIRNDIDKGFKFPAGFELKTRLIDVLESDVDKKFYLSNSRISALLAHKARNEENGNGFGAQIVTKESVYSHTITTDPDKSAGQYLAIKDNTKKGFAEAEPGDYVNLKFDSSKSRRGRVQKGMAQTIICEDMAAVVESNLKIRKLTPLECFRLMAFNDSDYKVLAENGISNSQIYKMAGNSIVVSVLEYLFSAIFNQYGDIFETGKTAEEFGKLIKYDPQQMTFDDLFKLGEY